MVCRLLVKSVSFFCLFLLLASCGQSKKEQFEPGSTVAPAPSDALFELVKCGIDFENKITESHQNTILVNSYLYNGGGVGVIDFNNDNLSDLFFVGTQGACKLYQNTGNFAFQDVTDKAGVAAAEGDKSGVTIVDVNADGWQDIYVCRTGMQAKETRRNLLFINNQNGTFTEKAKEYGLADIAASNHANFFDADNDGDLDCYVLNYPVNFKAVNSTRLVDEGNGKTSRKTTPDDPNDSDHFYRNNGNNTFTDVSKEAGINNWAFGLSVTTSDLNNDGYLDIVVGNDYIEPDFVYINNPAKPGTFTDQYSTYFRHSSNHTMGVDIADLNNDGNQDIVALDMLAESYSRQKELMTTMLLDRYTTLNKYGYGKQQMRNVLQLNNGKGSFSEIGCEAGIFQTDWSWAPLAQDFDNDGNRDLYITNGYRRDVSNLDYLTFTADSIQRTGGLTKARFPKIEDYLDLIPSTPLQNYCFKNTGDLKFENMSTAWGFVERSYSNGAVYADLDNDGDLDLVVNNLDHQAFVYKNKAVDSGKGGAWLQLQLKGSAQNPMATGARARVQVSDKVYYQELTPTHGFLSSVQSLFHFGLGNASSASRVEIEFPGNQLVVLENVALNKRYTVSFADGKPGKLTPIETAPTRLREVAAPAFRHTEDDIQDFNRERLLPWKLSTPGCIVAAGDVNGDGLGDFYAGNAAGAAGALFVQKGGRFQAVSAATWEADKNAEDAGAVFFDADGDGDQDLVVTSGGNSYNDKDPNYQPRLYKNDGKGNFSAAKGLLPPIKTSNGAVSAHDFDGDGDQDLVIGGWCTPLAWPTTPPSYVLRNDNGVFQDVTNGMAPDLAKTGMVRAIQWADLDGDKNAEMIITGEWMNVEVFAVQGGRFERATERFGLGNTQGFWRSLAAADIDGDGDQDLIAGNLGLNTRYTATPDAPLRVFARDFDKNGSIDPIMTMTQNGKNVPIPFRDVLLKQLPILKKKFVRYTPYSEAFLEDLYSDADLKEAQQLQCNYLASGIFINNNGKFSFTPLPNYAQIAPTNSIQVVDWQKDGAPDLILAGNDYGQQVETGPLDAGNGVVLVNNGKGIFAALAPAQSGLWANRDSRSLVVLEGPGGKKWIVVGNNNDSLQCFSLE